MLSEYNLKAVVFDDVEKEAKPLIDALNYERIPNIFINFKDDDREDKKLKNIRIVFADLIVGQYQSGDDSATVEAIRTAILDNIEENNGPFILAIWSKHNNLAETLETRLLEINPTLNFAVIKLDKNDYFEKDGDIWKLKKDKNFKDIRNDINEQLNTLNYLPIFLEWERDARESISMVLNDFIENIADGEKVKNTVSSAIKSTLGNQIKPNLEDKMKAFYQTLNTVLADSIINNSTPLKQHQEFLNTLNLDSIDAEIKAQINAKVLFEVPINNELKTGNIYSYNDFQNILCGDVIKDVCGCDNYNTLRKELFRYTKKCKFFDKGMNESDISHQNRHFNKMEIESYPILLEFTPSCDAATTKYNKSRLILGYMINSEYACLEKECDSLYITRFHFKYKDELRKLNGNYRLAFIIKNIFAVNPEKIKQITPMIRARKEFATDLQHSIANHISRIGISSLDTKWD